MSLPINQGDFQHIQRICNTNVDGRVKVAFALTAIKGIGRRFATLICKKCEIDTNKRAGELTQEEIQKLVQVITNPQQFRIPQWFLNRQHDPVDGTYSQKYSNLLDGAKQVSVTTGASESAVSTPRLPVVVVFMPTIKQDRHQHRPSSKASKAPPPPQPSRSLMVFVLPITFILIFGATIISPYLDDNLHFVSFKSAPDRFSPGSHRVVNTTVGGNEESPRREIDYISSISLEHVKELVSRVKAAAKSVSIRVVDLPDEFDPERLVREYPVCSEWQWSNEYKFPKILKQQYVARPPEGPDWCLVPFMAKCWFNMVAKYKLAVMAEAAYKVVDAIRSDAELQQTCPPRKQASLRRPSRVFMKSTGDQLGGFYKARKDIIIPATPKLKVSHHGGPRRLLALFRGSIELHLRDSEGREVRRTNILRRALIDNLGHVDTDIVVGQSAPSYEAEMRDSIFCFIPRGNTPWTRRIFDAIVSGCIPVVLSNAIVFPFESILDWSQFTLKLPESYVLTKPEEIVNLLRGIVGNPPLLSRLQNNLYVVSHMSSDQKGSSHIEAFTPLEGVLHHLAKHGEQLNSTLLNNTAATFWTPLRGMWIEELGNTANQ
ncbi:ribosomal 40S subunit protein S18B, partial [Perkinsus chesapeaki]